ncbi:MAG: GAF domain-containing protein [Chitinivibrionia bacterium]|nr:GAF domain-containing protein [Chitinivibrionia bacterium]
MEAMRNIPFAGVMSANYLVFSGVFLGILLYVLMHERRADRARSVFASFAGALCFYLGRLAAVRAETNAAETPDGAWFAAAGACNMLGALFAVAVGRRIAAAEPDPVELDQAPAEPSPMRSGAYIIAHGAIAGAAGGGAYAALAYAGLLTFSISYLAAAVLASVVGRLLWMCVRPVARSRTEARAAVIGAMIALALAWAAFHATLIVPASGRAAPTMLSRLLDTAALFAVLHCLLVRRTQQRLLFRHLAIVNRQKTVETRDELSRLTKLSSQIHDDNSELIKKLKAQAKQFMRRSENLENTLQVGLEIQKKQELRDLLQRIVELVRDNLGFETVVLRLLMEKTQSFESRAYVGVKEEMEGVVANYRIPKSEFNKMIEPHVRISRSYFIRNTPSWSGNAASDYQTLEGGDAWREIDMLIVPMQDEEDKILGYLSVENPRATDMPVADVIENLESIAMLAVTAIKNANLFTELEEKNEKLKLYAEKLESLNKMKSNFVSTISHEFKTPLTSIKAYCETLINNADTVDREIIKEFLRVIDDESNRLMTLIEDILNFSKMESGAMKFERVQCSLKTVLENAVKDLEPSFSRKNISIGLAMPEKDVIIRADSEMMKQLGMNLLHNAAKFTPERGQVRVLLEDETISAKIIVEDNGNGIPDDQMEKIFEHFHQVDNSNTRKHGGSGLGLALCKNIAEWHDGKIWVENVHGGGARFIAILPKKQVVVRNQTAGLSGAVRRFEVERYLELLIEMVAELLVVKRASIMLFDVSKSELKIESAIGIDEEIVENARVKLGDSISGRVVAEGRTYLVEDIEQDPRTYRCNNEYLYDSKSFLSVPIKIQGEVVGVVNVANPIKKRTFDEEDKGLLEMFV